MKNNKKERLLLGTLVILSALVAACSEDVSVGAESGSSSHVESAQSSLDSQNHNGDPVRAAWAMLSMDARLGGVEQVHQAPSWEALVVSFSPRDREYLESVNANYLGVLAFDTPEEQARMIAQGFPTAEEWLAARDLTDSELRDSAIEGNYKSAVLLADRAMGRADTARAHGVDTNGQSPAGVQFQRDIATSTQFVDQALVISRSPFAAYAAGRQRSIVYRRAEPLIAGAMVARQLGDERAAAVVSSVSGPQGSFDQESVMGIYDYMMELLDKS